MRRAPAGPARIRDALAGRARAATALAGLALLSVASAALACELPGGTAQALKSSAYTLLYRTAPLRIGEHFAVDFIVCPAPESVRVDAWMPEHRHGMNYRPEVRAQGGGRYRAEGLMLHMAGRWELVFEMRSAGKTERLAQSLQLE
jgi:hypothetical protein